MNRAPSPLRISLPHLVLMALVPAAGPVPLLAQLGAREATPATDHADIARADSIHRHLDGLEGATAVLLILVGDDVSRSAPILPSWDELAALRSAERAGELAARIRGDVPVGDPSHTFDGRWRAARLALGLGMVAEDWETQAFWHRWGILWALEAAAAEERLHGDGPGTEGLYWLAANVGRYALDSPFQQERARAGDAAYHLARTLLERDPHHAGAHNLLGRSHLEVRRLGFATRMLARAFMGGEFVSRASWEAAEHHLSRAVELDPGMLYYRLDLGLFHQLRGNSEPLHEELNELLRRPERHPLDGWIKDEARRVLGGGAPPG